MLILPGKSASWAAGGFDPGTDDTSLYGWYDTSISSNVTVSGTNVTNVADSAGSQDLSNILNTPQYNPGTHTLGSNDCIQIPISTTTAHGCYDSNWVPPSGDFSMHMAVAVDSLDNGGNQFYDDQAAFIGIPTSPSFALIAATDVNDNIFDGDITGTNITRTALSNIIGTPSGLKVITVEFDFTGSEVRCYVGGTLECTAAMTSTPWSFTNPSVLRWGQGTLDRYAGYRLGELCITEAAFTTRSDYVTYLDNKWS